MTMQSDTRAKKSAHIENVTEYAFIIHIVLTPILFEISSTYGLVAGLAATFAIMVVSAGIQLRALKSYRPTGRFRAGPKPRWKLLKSMKEADQIEGMQSMILGMIPFLVLMVFMALTSAGLGLTTLLMKAL